MSKYCTPTLAQIIYYRTRSGNLRSATNCKVTPTEVWTM